MTIVPSEWARDAARDHAVRHRGLVVAAGSYAVIGVVVVIVGLLVVVKGHAVGWVGPLLGAGYLYQAARFASQGAVMRRRRRP